MEKGLESFRNTPFFTISKKLLFQALPIYTRDRLLASPRSTDPICCSPLGLHPTPSPSFLLTTTVHPAMGTCSHPARAGAIHRSCFEHPSGWSRTLKMHKTVPALPRSLHQPQSFPDTPLLELCPKESPHGSSASCSSCGAQQGHLGS